MKKSKKFALGLMMACALCGMTACGDDDDDTPEPPVPVTPTPDDPSDEPELNSIVYKGKTKTYPVATPEYVYETQVSTYTIVYNEATKTAVLKITDASFSPMMPSLQVMEFPGINYIKDQKDGVFKLQKDNLIPEIGERPFPSFPISNLVAVEDPNVSLELQFICDFKNTPMQVSFSGTPVK